MGCHQATSQTSTDKAAATLGQTFQRKLTTSVPQSDRNSDKQQEAKDSQKGK